MIDDELLDDEDELSDTGIPLLADEDGEIGVLPEEDEEDEIPEGMHEVGGEEEGI